MDIINTQSINCTEKCWSKLEHGKLTCNCGNNIKVFEWFWDGCEKQSSYTLDREKFVVTFHPIYSPGNSVVRGNEPFEANMHYYWELKIISQLYGTDVMIGVGTKQGLQNLNRYKFKFCSLLGLDDQTWGYSYHGKIQHDRLQRNYGDRFGLSSKIGVHLDMYSGKLEYYLNRQPLGVAFTGLKNKKLYPIASATAAQSSMQMMCSVSQKETLQMLCLKSIHRNVDLYKAYCSIPGLKKIFSKKYVWITQNIPKPSITIIEEEDELYYFAINKNTTKRRTNMIQQRSKKIMLQSSKSNMSSLNESVVEIDLSGIHRRDLNRFLSNALLNPNCLPNP